MYKWTTEQRYATYDSYPKDYLKALQTAQQNSRWHLGYHVQPLSGLLNDPNGFSYFNHEWHLFYQNFPFGPVHGLKSWRHLASDDLVHWQDRGDGPQPHQPFSTQGVYSGSALAVGDRLFMMYTGNVRTEDGGRISSQLGAWMDQDGQIDELPKPLITGQPDWYTAHFRDPQIIHQNGRYYAILGAQQASRTGRVLVYSAPQPEGPWTCQGPLDFGYDNLGCYMIECPNLAFVDGKVVFIFCPQGLDHDVLDYDNIYPNTYIVADGIDWANNRLINPGALHQLDHGFDCYAAQVVNGPDDSAHLISWMGLPETQYVSDSEGWQGCYSLVRKLSVRDDRLVQTPVISGAEKGAFDPVRAKLGLQECIRFNLSNASHLSATFGDERESLQLTVADGYATINRSNVPATLGEGYGSTRRMKLPPDVHQLSLYLDRSCFELYADDGTDVLSGRYFPTHPDDWHLTIEDAAAVQVSGVHLRTIY